MQGAGYKDRSRVERVAGYQIVEISLIKPAQDRILENICQEEEKAYLTALFRAQARHIQL